MIGLLDAIRASLKEELRMDVISNNLANSTVVGFKADRVAFQDLLLQQSLPGEKNDSPSAQGPDPSLLRIETDMSQGQIWQTGNDLDLAINGGGYFKVRTPDGTRYTRKGNFKLDTTQHLVTQQGYQVLGKNGPITLPEGRVLVGKDGSVRVGKEEVDQLDVVEFSSPKRLVKESGALFRARPGAKEAPLSAGTTVEQGFLESSNVNVVEEMVHMIHSMRAFESYQRIIKVMDRMDSEAINDVGRLR